MISKMILTLVLLNSVVFLALFWSVLQKPADAEDSAEAAQPAAPVSLLVSRETAAPIAKWQSRTLYGEISQKNSKGIYLVSEKSEDSADEIWFAFENGMNVSGYKHISEIESGDFVSVSFEELPGTDKKTLKAISLIRKGQEEEPQATVSAKLMDELEGATQ